MRTHEPAVCELCGEPSRVRILAGYVGHRPRTRNYCLPCPELIVPATSAKRGMPGAVAVGPRAMLMAAVIGSSVALAKALGASVITGLGWQLGAGLAIGLTLTIGGMAPRGSVTHGCRAVSDNFAHITRNGHPN